MATEAQIAANRRNAQASTGPTTAEGKARVSRNATIFGLYSAADTVQPGQEPIYHLFCEGFQQDLAPEGAMETTLAAEIIHAAWRLRRCAEAESAIEIQTDGQSSIDRARAQALRHFQRASAELRRLQTERQIRNETVPDNYDTATLGLASCKDMAPVLKSDLRRQLLLHKLEETEMATAITEAIRTRLCRRRHKADRLRRNPRPSARRALPVRFRSEIQTLLRHKPRLRACRRSLKICPQPERSAGIF